MSGKAQRISVAVFLIALTFIGTGIGLLFPIGSMGRSVGLVITTLCVAGHLLNMKSAEG